VKVLCTTISAEGTEEEIRERVEYVLDLFLKLKRHMGNPNGRSSLGTWELVTLDLESAEIHHMLKECRDYIEGFEEHEGTMGLKISNVKHIELQDWNDFVTETYDRPYHFQQQEGCKSRGTFRFNVPLDDWPSEDYGVHDEIPETINGEVMCVKFDKWLERDPKEPLSHSDPSSIEFDLRLWWHRNFYPSIHMLIDDLHKKGLLEEGEYAIIIDW